MNANLFLFLRSPFSVTQTTATNLEGVVTLAQTFCGAILDIECEGPSTICNARKMKCQPQSMYRNGKEGLHCDR